jgi:hypothetical protein
MTDCYRYVLILEGEEIDSCSEQSPLDDVIKDEGLHDAIIDVRPCGKCKICKPSSVSQKEPISVFD